ncbi:hypothetical protein [Paraglaciecola sp. L3A3]|uniref:hypothetical protein n=1 Tax=Paraglaciecola sp. L3A3 TaxID=2686358 RepID=UPI00131D5ED5|nr:hypothetical protein [Paraglaciecola sp. L3A3]
MANENKNLAKIIELGLNETIKDGSFDKLFNQYFAEDVARANLTKRRIFKIEAFDESANLPLNRKELWFTHTAL